MGMVMEKGRRRSTGDGAAPVAESGDGARPVPLDGTIRALGLVEELCARPEGVSVSELAELERENRGLTHRALASLVAAGWVVQDVASSRYRLTGRVLQLGSRYHRGLGFERPALEIMQRVADGSQCTAEVARVIDGYPRLILAATPTLSVPRMIYAPRIGELQVPHVTAAGKVWLASLSRDAFEQEVNRSDLRLWGPHAITDIAVLRREIAVVRERGVAVNDGEAGDDWLAVAVPIKGLDGAYVGSLGLVRTTLGLQPGETETLARLATEAAMAIGELLPPWALLPR